MPRKPDLVFSHKQTEGLFFYDPRKSKKHYPQFMWGLGFFKGMQKTKWWGGTWTYQFPFNPKFKRK